MFNSRSKNFCRVYRKPPVPDSLSKSSSPWRFPCEFSIKLQNVFLFFKTPASSYFWVLQLLTTFQSKKVSNATTSFRSCLWLRHIVWQYCTKLSENADLKHQKEPWDRVSIYRHIRASTLDHLTAGRLDQPSPLRAYALYRWNLTVFLQGS